MKKSFRILLTLVLAVVMVLSLTACLSDCEAGKHAFVDVAAKPATCETAGNIAYKKCPVCGLCVDTDGKQITEADITIAAIGHVFDKEVATPAYLQTEATCGNPATYFKSCVCGEKGTETFTVGDASSHVYNQEVVHADYLASAATCTAKATYYKSCTCGAKGTETFEHGDLAAHTYGTWNDGTPATCQATGTKAHQHCSVCEKNYDADDTLIADITIAKDSSNHVDLTPVVATPASCTADGILAHSKCACGATLINGEVVTSVVDAQKPHTYGTWNDGTPATCVATGTKAHQYCSVCEKNYDADGVEIADITIAKDTTNGHKAATDWTVGEDGKHYHVCQNGCGTYLDEAAHVYDQTVATDAYADKAATCTAKATYFKSCVCGEKGTETFEHGDFAAHSVGDWDFGNDATCIKTGIKGHYTCSVCKQNLADDKTTVIDDLTIAIDLNNHANRTSYDEDPATCTKEGKKEHLVCDDCGAIILDGATVDASALVIAKLPHTYGTWNDGTPATCVETGTKGHYICSVCEKNYDADGVEIADITIAIDSNAHDYKYADTSSTKHTVTCGREGCTYTAQLVEHSYAADTHKCLCGKTEPKVGWHLVTDASDLAAGDQIIIVGSKDPKFYTIVTKQNKNNRAAVEITKNADGSFALGDTVQIIVIAAGNKEGTFALSVGTNSYLYAAGGTKDNYLRTTTTLDDKASWTIEISQQGVATIKAVDSDTTKNWLRYNSTNGIFSCYGSGQNDVNIYKKGYEACDHVGKETETTTVEATCTTDGATTVTCKYCGEAISTTVIKGGHVYGIPVVNASDSTKHTYTCTREGCDDSYSEAHIYENHVCTKCNAAEPSYKITVTNTAIDGNSATVVVKVGDDVISAGDDGKYSIYQNSNVAITITAPENKTFDSVTCNGVAIEDFVGTHQFTITADVTIVVTLKDKQTDCPHTNTKAAPLDIEHSDYVTDHKIVCLDCTEELSTEVHNLQPKQITGDETNHKLVCVCGYEETEKHSFGDAKPCTDDTTKHQQTCSVCEYVFKGDHDYNDTTHKCIICSNADSSYVLTVADALTAAKDTKVDITGMTVKFYSSGKNSFYLQEGDNTIIVYSPDAKFGLGDTVRVVGTIGAFNNVNQVNQATVTLVAEHVCDFEPATCTEPATCPICEKTSGEKLGHGEANAEGKCPRCGEDLSKITVTAKYTGSTSNMSGDSNNASVIGLDSEIFNVTSTKLGGSVQVGLNKDGYIRLYKEHNVELTIATIGDYEIVSIEVVTKSGTVTVKAGSTVVAAVNGTYAINGSSVTIYNTSSDFVDITSIKIVYKQVATSEADE